MRIGQNELFVISVVGAHYRLGALERVLNKGEQKLLDKFNKEIFQCSLLATVEIDQFSEQRAQAIVNGAELLPLERVQIIKIGEALVGNRGYKQEVLFNAGMSALCAVLNPNKNALEAMFE